MKQRLQVLSIAGFDPSGGAGLFADVKTFEQNKTLGLAIQSANTIQTEDSFVQCNWIDQEIILKQLEAIVARYPKIIGVKIGLVPNLTVLKMIIDLLKTELDKTPILVWDPVLSASSGFSFHHTLQDEDLKDILSSIDWITPNIPEKVSLFGDKDLNEISKKHQINIFLKGGHNTKTPGKDYLFTGDKTFPFNPKSKFNVSEKHGSGCIFSSALLANLVKGYPKIKACLRAKDYTAKALASNLTKLAYHHF